eukprot:6186379-Pleurochrysis_carterae.AAC.3
MSHSAQTRITRTCAGSTHRRSRQGGAQRIAAAEDSNRPFALFARLQKRGHHSPRRVRGARARRGGALTHALVCVRACVRVFVCSHGCVRVRACVCERARAHACL